MRQLTPESRLQLLSDEEPSDEDKIRTRQPILGANAWPLIVQLFWGIAAGLVAIWVIGDHVYNATVTFTRFIGLT